MKYAIALAAMGPALVAAHGFITSPTPRTAGSAMASACGSQIYNNMAADAYGNIQGETQLIQSDFTSDCNLWLCKGMQYADNTASVQSYSAGDVVDITYDIRAPHTGTANVSIVDTATNTVIGDQLAYWGVFASNSGGDSANETSFSITIPDLSGKCTTAGDCVIQHYWNSDSAGQTYESCIDFTVGGSSSGSTGSSSSAAASSAVATSTKAATTSAAAVTTSAAAVTEKASTTSSAAAATTSAADDDDEDDSCDSDDDGEEYSTSTVTVAPSTTASAPAQTSAPATDDSDDDESCDADDGEDEEATTTSSAFAAEATGETGADDEGDDDECEAEEPTSAVPVTSAAATTKAASSAAAPTTLATKVSSSKAATSTSGSSSGSVALYGQCGGANYQGSTTCAEGTCTVMNDYYSQCVN